MVPEKGTKEAEWSKAQIFMEAQNEDTNPVSQGRQAEREGIPSTNE